MRCSLEDAARAAAPDVLEFMTWPRMRPGDLDDARLRELLGVPAGEDVTVVTLDAFLEWLTASTEGHTEALRRLRRAVRSNLMDVRVAVAGDVACVIGTAPTGGMAGFSARLPHLRQLR
jgi:sugar phosphate isomerase/epimerase